MQNRNNGVISVGSDRQLFIDSTFIDKSHGIGQIVHKPRKTGEMNIVRAGTPHERIGGYSSVLYEDGRYRMWYSDNTYREDGIFIVVRYAESRDGIIWEHPSLGLAAEADKGENSIVLGLGAGGVKGPAGDGSCMVFMDPNADPKDRYKMVARPGMGELMDLLSSPDGIRWSPYKQEVFDDGRLRGGGSKKKDGSFHLDSQNVIFWDSRIGRYVGYVRRNFELGGQYRTVARAEADGDFVFPPVEDMDVVLAPDRMDMPIPKVGFPDGLPAVDFYTNAAIRYPWAQNAYFMFPSLYYKYGPHLREFEQEPPRNAGPIDIRFAASRDGIRWERYDRSAYVGLGRKGEFDSYSLYMVHGIVPGGDGEMYLYYMGSDVMHGWDRGDSYEPRENRLLSKAGFDSKGNISAISRLALRRDGFVSVRGACTGGSLTTPLIHFDGDTLALNVDTSAAGTIRVGFLDDKDCFIEGYGLSDCDCIHTANEINKAVSFHGSRDLRPLAGRPVKLYFELYDTDLYAFQFICK